MMRLLRLLAFWRCRHKQTTWVFRDDAGLYRRCCDCGARLLPTVDFRSNQRVLVRIEESKKTEQVA
jgi:hypothetical protein